MSNKKTNQSLTRVITVSGVCAAMAIALMYLHFPVKYLGFLELELSDVPAILCGLTMGPLPGLLVELVKNLVHLLSTSTAATGELANFIMSGCFVLGISIPYSLLKGHISRNKNLVLSGLIGTIALVIAGIVVNYFITVPLYITAFFGGNADPLFGMAQEFIPSIDSVEKLILIGITPFNVVKGVIVTIVSSLVYKLVADRI
ncbi:MAG: ECF transporter S component [Lachnospiraceae bacterium]